MAPLRPDDPASVGPYRLAGRLGEGGQGVVYLGQARDGAPVAIKVLRDGLGGDDRFAKEIAAARRVEPFCIAQVLDASLGERGGRPYIVTEYVEGPSLHEAGRHAGADLQRLAVATTTALAAIHEAGVVHRDFKPANVLLGPGGPRVIDFGIARAADAAVTATSSVVGTPAYMAPEQLAGHDVGPAADVFAWASVIVFAGTGTPPFGDDTLPAIINRILHNEPQLGDLPRQLRSVVYACLAKDPAARPPMREVLLRLLGGDQRASAADAGPRAQPTDNLRPRRRRTTSAPAALVVPLAAVASIVLAGSLVSGLTWLGGSSGLWAATGQSPTPIVSGTGKTPRPGKTTRKPTPSPKKSRTGKPTPTPTPSPKKSTPSPDRTTPTADRTTAAPTPAKTTKKPVTSARVRVLSIDVKGGPGQDHNAGCYMPPVGFMGTMESTKSEVWVTYAWVVDGTVKLRTRSWVSEGEYTAPALAHQYMLKTGGHQVTLKVLAPGSAAKSVNFSVCSIEGA